MSKHSDDANVDQDVQMIMEIQRSRAMSKDCKEVFTDIYARRVWGEGSGGGSDYERAKPYCELISGLMGLMEAGRLPGTNALTVLDIGCGDLRIARAIDWHGAKYMGLEASNNPSPPPVELIYVPRGGELVLTNGGNHKEPVGIVRYGFDALTDELPPADIVLCKEVLQHLSNAQVELLLARTDHYPRRLFTSYVGEGTNSDIVTGQSRPVDLTLAPFNRPAREVLRYGNYIVQEL